MKTADITTPAGRLIKANGTRTEADLMVSFKKAPLCWGTELIEARPVRFLLETPAPSMPVPTDTADEAQRRRQHAAEILLRKLRYKQERYTVQGRTDAAKDMANEIATLLASFPTLS